MSQTANKKTVQRNRELGAIHAARRQLSLDEETYRTYLEAWTGKRSAAKLTGDERQHVIECFRRMGFERLPASEGELTINEDDKPQAKLIKALWLRLYRAGKVRDASLQALNAFVKRQAGTSHVSWLVPEKANSVIEALKAWLARDASEHEHAKPP